MHMHEPRPTCSLLESTDAKSGLSSTSLSGSSRASLNGVLSSLSGLPCRSEIVTWVGGQAQDLHQVSTPVLSGTAITGKQSYTCAWGGTSPSAPCSQAAARLLPTTGSASHADNCSSLTACAR